MLFKQLNSHLLIFREDKSDENNEHDDNNEYKILQQLNHINICAIIDAWDEKPGKYWQTNMDKLIFKLPLVCLFIFVKYNKTIFLFINFKFVLETIRIVTRWSRNISVTHLNQFKMYRK